MKLHKACFCHSTPMRSKFKEEEFLGEKIRKKPFLGYGVTAGLFIFILHRTGCQPERTAQAQPCPVPMFLLTFLRSHILLCTLPRLPKPIRLSSGCDYMSPIASGTAHVQEKNRKNKKKSGLLGLDSKNST